MSSDWQYIEDHMGGHDEDALPNFLKRLDFADSRSSDTNNYFSTFKEAMEWSKNNPGKTITRSSDGKGYRSK